MSEAALIHRSLVLVLLGLVPTLVCVLRVTPGTFVAFAVFGLPLVGLGMLGFVRVVWRSLRDRDED